MNLFTIIIHPKRKIVNNLSIFFEFCRPFDFLTIVHFDEEKSRHFFGFFRLLVSKKSLFVKKITICIVHKKIY